MLEINTIYEFSQLSTPQREEIQKALRCKERLEDWLRGEISKPKRPTNGIKGKWIPCKHCNQREAGENPGYAFMKFRDDSNINPSAITKCLRFNWHPSTVSST